MSAEVETIALGSVAEVKGGKRLPKGSSLQQTPNTHPYLRIVDFVSGGINQTNLLYVPDSVYPTISRYVVEPEDVFISIVGTIGVVGIIPDNLRGANLTENAARIRVNCDVYNPRFLMYFLMSPKGREQISSLTVGSTQPKLALFRIQEIQVPSIPIGDQLKIVSILNTLDRCIENLQSQNTTLEALAQTLFRSWFVNFDPVHAKAAGQTPEGMSPELAVLFPSEFVESELGMIPKGWSVVTVGSEFNLTMGQSPPGSSYNELGQGTLFFQGRTDFGFRFPSNRTYTTEPSRYAKSGNVLLSVRAPVGDINVALGDCCIGRGLAALSSKHEWHSYCLYAVKNLAVAFENFDKEGTIFGSINKADLSAMTLVGPDAALQQQFNKIAAPTDAQITVNEQMIRTLSTLRDELLPRLISGKLRIEEAEEAVSEVLGSAAEEEKAA